MRPSHTTCYDATLLFTKQNKPKMFHLKATILLVGYFILGPSDLYKLVKGLGQVVQNVRTLSSDAAKTFETTMESQLQLDEVKKAQRELNDAFSFRRSINVNQEEEAFATTTTSEKVGAEPIQDSSNVSIKKKIRRRKKIVQEKDDDVMAEEELEIMSTGMTSPWDGNVPDLDMADAFETDRTSFPNNVQPSNDWFSDTTSNTNDVPEEDEDDEDEMFAADAEAARFRAQLSNWNESILANEDKLSPLAKIMERLALLEEERAAQVFRLEEEFRERAALEDRFYRQKRELLEEAAAEVQADAYAVNPDESMSV